jgi:hypothetical protein
MRLEPCLTTLRLALASLCLFGSACTPSYYVVRSTPVVGPSASAPAASEPVHASLVDMKRIALVPWDGCTGQSAAERDRCASNLAAIERALMAHGFEVVVWQALREQATRHSQTTGEAAQALGIAYLLRVQAPEAARAPLTLRFQRSYFESSELGSVGKPLSLAARDADRLDLLAGRAEQSSRTADTSLLSLRVSLERTTGELLWSHRESLSAPVVKPPALTLFVHCSEGHCTPAQRPDQGSKRPARETSERLLVAPRESPASFERVADQLAARLASLARAKDAPSE